MEALIWVALIIIFVAIETATVMLVSIWFAGGALAGLISQALGADIKIQIFVFLLVSAFCVVILRDVALKTLKGKRNKTNVDRIIGREIVLVHGDNEINGSGIAVINDIEWKVISENGELVPAGEKVIIVGVEGVKLVVKRLEGE